MEDLLVMGPMADFQRGGTCYNDPAAHAAAQGLSGPFGGRIFWEGKEVGAAEKHIRRMSVACRSGWFPGRCFWRRAWPGRCWLSASALRPYSPPRYGCYLTVSLTPQEREALQQMAADRRLPVAVFVREALRREYRSNGHAQRLTADADAAGKEAAPVLT